LTGSKKQEAGNRTSCKKVEEKGSVKRIKVREIRGWRLGIRNKHQ